jgi:hypothetical protein
MEHPIRVTVTEDLTRNRLTVFFRPILAIPHLVWLGLWGIAASVIAVVNWFATLFTGTSPRGLHDFLAQYLRYATHVHGYLLFLADPYPKFLGNEPYDVDVLVAPPAPQNRWITGFRFITIIPAALVAGVLGYLIWVVALIAWVVCLVTGALLPGLRSLLRWILRFTTQTNAYGLILTDRYPDFSVEEQAA